MHNLAINALGLESRFMITAMMLSTFLKRHFSSCFKGKEVGR